jgi:lysine N6-hydroxylase
VAAGVRDGGLSIHAGTGAKNLCHDRGANKMRQYDLVGVGIGPFNLSLAALLTNVPSLKSCFIDRSSHFVWHPGMLFSQATIQVSHLYDLVTMVDPTNPYSFLSYLADNHRLYRFANSKFTRVMRKEFSDYYSWASKQLPNLVFGEEVTSIDFEQQHFHVKTRNQYMQAANLVLGAGLIPYVPHFARQHLGRNIFHCHDFMAHAHTWKNKRVVVVGGGQSGAEIFSAILSDDNNLPHEISWISRRNSFLPMDETPFTNEIYTPTHTESFYQQSPLQKKQLIQEQMLSSDGISSELLDSIYRRLYILECLNGYCNRIKLMPRHSLSAMPDSTHLRVQNIHTNRQIVMSADIVIFCTGYRWQLPECMSSLKQRISFDDHGRLIVNHDYSIQWDGSPTNQIFVQNAARHTHGVVDPNLCLAAWRSAKIINSLAQRPIYHIDHDDSTVDWDVILNQKNEELKHAANS